MEKHAIDPLALYSRALAQKDCPCAYCSVPIKRGTEVWWVQNKGVMHLDCVNDPEDFLQFLEDFES